MSVDLEALKRQTWPWRRYGGFTVRKRLTTHREARDIEAMVSRMLAALRRRAAGGDEQALVALCHLESIARVEQGVAARALHSDQEFSWARLGLITGMTKQAAHERWSRS